MSKSTNTTYIERVSKLQRYSFLSPPGGGVSRVADKCGNWLEEQEAVKLAQAADEEIYQLKEKIALLEQELKFARNERVGAIDINELKGMLVKDGLAVN